MIEMFVTDQNRVDAVDVVSKALQPQIGAGIDEETDAVNLYQARTAEPLVLRIIGCTHLTIADRKGHACGCTRTKQGETHPSIRHFVVRPLRTSKGDATNYPQALSAGSV